MANLKDIKDALRLVNAISTRRGVPFEKCVGVILDFDEATATERSTKEERLAVMDALHDYAAGHPRGVPVDPREVVAQVGLKQCQADRAFVRHHVARFLEARDRQAAE